RRRLHHPCGPRGKGRQLAAARRTRPLRPGAARLRGRRQFASQRLRGPDHADHYPRRLLMTALRFRLKHGADRVVDRAIGLIPWPIAGLFGGVAIHLILLLALPRLAPGSTYRKVALEAPLGQVELLPPAAPETP